MYGMLFIENAFLPLRTGNTFSSILLDSQSVILRAIHPFDKHLFKIYNVQLLCEDPKKNRPKTYLSLRRKELVKEVTFIYNTMP